MVWENVLYDHSFWWPSNFVFFVLGKRDDSGLDCSAEDSLSPVDDSLVVEFIMLKIGCCCRCCFTDRNVFVSIDFSWLV